MARPKLPPPPLTDPRNEREIFATEVSQVGFLEGNAMVTLACVRLEEVATGQPPEQKRVVVARLVLTKKAASQMLNRLQSLSNKIEAMTTPPTASSH